MGERHGGKMWDVLDLRWGFEFVEGAVRFCIFADGDAIIHALKSVSGGWAAGLVPFRGGS